jgi:hypothetical protein
MKVDKVAIKLKCLQSEKKNKQTLRNVWLW